MTKWIVGILTLFIFTGRVFAEGMTLKTTAFQEVVSKDEKGRLQIKRIPAEKVLPGTEVLYVITYQNEGKKPSGNVFITNPLPDELIYVASLHDTSQANLTVSVDNGKTYNTLENLKVKAADGKLRPAKSSDVTHLRWTLKSSVPSGGSGTVSFKTILK